MGTTALAVTLISLSFHGAPASDRLLEERRGDLQCEIPAVRARAAAVLGKQAARIVADSHAGGGVCVVLGAEDANLAIALAKQGPFVVQCLAGSAGLTATLRNRIHSREMYGTVTARTLTGRRLPYTDNLINILVVRSEEGLRNRGISARELLRVLAPLGIVHIAAGPSRPSPLRAQLVDLGATAVSPGPDGGSSSSVRKPWPADIDEWTHYLHGPDGNPVARDTVVGPPKHYQWVSDPLWQRSHETDSSISTIVTARGRLFYIVDEAPISLAGQHSLPDKWCCTARDAFNGMLLWKVPIRRWGWREWKESWFNTRPGDIPLNIQKRLVAVDNRVYVTLGYQAPVSELDARTGEVLKTFEGTERTNEILYTGGVLFLSILADGGVRVAAFNAASGTRRWLTDKAYRGSTVDYIKWKAMHGSIKPPVLDPSLNTATDGTVIALIDGPDLICLDAATGAEKWRSAFPTAEADLRAGGIRSRGNLWIGTMIVSHGVVIHASPSVLAAFSAATGRLLWQRPKRYIQHLWYEWKDVFVIGDLVWTWNAELARARTLYPTSVRGYDIRTGELKRTVPLGRVFSTYHHHRCYRNKATVRYILASRRGTEFVDLEEGKHTVHNWVRGTCHVGMMPANGLHYAPPHPCQCYIDEKLKGMNALAATLSGTARGVEGAGDNRRRQGPAFGHAAGAEAGDQDWPTFRHDSMRTGAVATDIPDGAKQRWQVRIGRKISAPIAVGNYLYLSVVDEHHIVCLDVRSGRTAWTFAAGGRIDSPPTYGTGRLYVGAADGWIYCLRASDGVLVWRFRAAPEDRLIGAFGQLESAWPVHGSILLAGETVYAVAGRSSQLDGGIRMYGLDASTGACRHTAVLAGPDYAVGDFEENYQLPMGSLPDVLMSDGDRLYMRTKAFDMSLKPVTGRPQLAIPGGFLDDSYFKRIPWRFEREYARLIVHDKRSAYYVRMFDTLRGLDPTVFFTPGKQGYLLFAKNLPDGKRPWRKRVPVRVRAMVLAKNRLVVAGPPDVVDRADPLGSFEGRKGGVLYILDAVSGETVVKHTLPSPPVFNGAVAANGRLLIVSEDGSVTCFGG